MHSRKALIPVVFSLLMVSTLMATAIPSSSNTIQKMNQMPLSFIKNMGQWDERVIFRVNAGGAMMWFTKEGVTYQFTRRISSTPSPLPVGEGWLKTGERAIPLDRFDNMRDSVEQLVLATKLVGANANPDVVAEGQLEYKCNYFLGNEPSKWRTDVPNYSTITLKNIYPGIDLKYSGNGTGQVAYEFEATPGADISQIKIAYDGIEETSIDTDGRMVVATKWGDMIVAMKSPTNGVLSGTASLSQLSEKAIGFEASGSNPKAPGAFAVVLVYSTYIGGDDRDEGTGIAVDESGNAYVTGFTGSSNFPTTPEAYDPIPNGSYEAFVAKFSASGTLIYSTFLGGGDDDFGLGIAVDGSGNAYVTGQTYSNNFPTLNPYQTYQGPSGNCDVFVTKLSSSGNSLIYSTYVGGAGHDVGSGIAVDGSGYAYVSGWTESSNFPTMNPYQSTYQGVYCDAFVTKLSDSGNSLIYSTYLGGNNVDYGNGITIDGSGCAYVTGYTESSNFPTLNPFQTDQGYWDVFVTKFSSSGNSLIYSTYIGGEGGDVGWGIAVDGSGNAYVAGWTYSSDFPTLNPYQLFQGSGADAFVTKISSAGNSLLYSTYLGGGSYDFGFGIAIDTGGNAFVTGVTSSTNFPTQNPYQGTLQGSLSGYYDVFVTKLAGSGSSLIYSTYLGGGDNDYGNSIAIDGTGNAFVTGYTESSNFPTLNPIQTYQGPGGNRDAYVTKLSEFQYLCGDANGDGVVDISDAVNLLAYIFTGGSAPHPLIAGDANCDNTVDISDGVYLIAYIFSGGSAPCAQCK